MALLGDYAYRPPGGNAYGPSVDPANNSDVGMEQKPPNLDAETHDVVNSANRLKGARGVPGLTERGT